MFWLRTFVANRIVPFSYPQLTSHFTKKGEDVDSEERARVFDRQLNQRSQLIGNVDCTSYCHILNHRKNAPTAQTIRNARHTKYQIEEIPSSMNPKLTDCNPIVRGWISVPMSQTTTNIIKQNEVRAYFSSHFNTNLLESPSAQYFPSSTVLPSRASFQAALLAPTADRLKERLGRSEAPWAAVAAVAAESYAARLMTNMPTPVPPASANSGESSLFERESSRGGCTEASRISVANLVW